VRPPPDTADAAATNRNTTIGIGAMYKYALRTLVLLPFVCAPSGLAAQSSAPMMDEVNSSFLEGMEYRLVGPFQGGRVTTVTGVPSQPRTFYMGVASGGLFRTTDGGESWEPLTDGQVPLGSSGSVAVADSDPNVIYYGTGSDGLRSNVSTGRGVYRSTDGGETWSFAGLRDVGQIGAVRIHPTDPNTAWVAAGGDAFKPSPERGVYKTTDGGRTWRNTLFVSDSTGAMDVELQPGNPQVVYAWMNRIERKPWTIISGSREGGFYKSTDGGESFTKMMTGLPSELIGKGNLAVTAADPQRVYALVEAKPGGGFYRSDDAGRTWQDMRRGASPEMQRTFDAMIQRPFYYTTIGADPTNADVVYTGAEGFYKSTDGGHTFQRMGTPHGDNHDIWINPNDGNTMVQANDGGANVSFDGGQTWSTQYNQPTSEIYGIHIDDRFPYRLYGAQQDDGTHMISSVADGGERNVDWWPGPGCETGPVVPHPSRPNIVYGSCKGQFEVLDLETGQAKPYWVGAQSLYGNPGRDLILRFQRVSPMETSPHDPEVLYYGSQHVHRTRDMGVTWETISPDLTANPECCQGASGEPITRDVTGEEFYSTLYAIAESPHQAGVIWTGANDGPFHITRDNGQTWTDITPPDLPEGGRVTWIDVSPHRQGSAYYSVHRYLLGDYQPYIYRTDDYGNTWKRLTTGQNGIPVDNPTRAIREDPGREGLLYAGTEFGMFVSFDNGDHWQAFDLNLPNVPINDIQVKNDDVVIATQGRAIWVLDNVSSLHQITPQTRVTDVHLYAPRDGYRTSAAPQILGPNIEYYLPTPPSGRVTLEILDASGNAVNSYDDVSSAGEGEGGGGFGFGRRRGPPPPRVTANPGFNRVVWNVQDDDGLTVPPGQYQARLTVGDVTQTQRFNVLIDPRVAAGGVTVADLREQYEHNKRMNAMVDEVQALVARVERAQESGDAALQRRLAPVAEKLITAPIRYSKPGLEDHITYLRGMTARVDMKIGRDAIERYQVLRAELDQVTAEVNRILGNG
jgi:photosystem II stability/assembly factor-like uncharacterized protein